MKRLWFSLSVLCILICSTPVLLLYFGCTVFFTCTVITLYKKFVRNNKESISALFLNVVLDLVNYFCKFIRFINFVSDVEALRLPNYLTLLLKAQQDVQYEKVQIGDDTTSIIIYRPNTIRNNGLIVYSHGGGWVMFTARMFHHAVSWIAHETQMVTISVDYRRPPELDVYYTILWAQLNAGKLGIDSSNVILMGDSSGGNLAAAATLLHWDQGHAPHPDHPTLNKHSFPPIKAQVLIYPVLQSYNYTCGSYLGKDLTNLRKYVSYYLAGDLSLCDRAGDPDCYAGQPAYWAAVVEPATPGADLIVKRTLNTSSPADNLSNVYCFPLLDEDPSGLPPTYLLALSRDGIMDDAVHYAKWLEHSGVQVEYVEESQANHGFMFLYGSDECALQHLRTAARFIWKQVGEVLDSKDEPKQGPGAEPVEGG